MFLGASLGVTFSNVKSAARSFKKFEIIVIAFAYSELSMLYTPHVVPVPPHAFISRISPTVDAVVNMRACT